MNSTQILNLTGQSRNSINKLFKAIRIKIADLCEIDKPFSGEVEVEESYFGAKRKKGKRGRGAYVKTNEFGIYKCNGRFYKQIVPNCSRASLQAVIKEKVNKDSVIHSYQW